MKIYKHVIKFKFLFSQSLLIIIESKLGKTRIMIPHLLKFCINIIFQNEKYNTSHVLKYIHTQYIKNDNGSFWHYGKLVCIHIFQTYLTELPILLNPLLLFSRISNNSKFFNGPLYNLNIFLRFLKFGSERKAQQPASNSPNFKNLLQTQESGDMNELLGLCSGRFIGK